MQRDRFSGIARLVILAGFVALAIWLLAGGLSQKPSQSSPPLASVPQQAEPPLPVPTEEPGSNITPTVPEPTATPSPVTLLPAVLVTPISVLNVSQDPNVLQVGQVSINSGEPIHTMAWAPTGDKLLYVTNSGNLYWSNTDGSNMTLLHEYPSDTIWRMLDDQQPMTNTLILTHNGLDQGMSRGPAHLDVIHFTPGQPPTLEEVTDAGAVYQIHWWSTDRASGVELGGYEGGEKLITLDANGHKVEERYVPYMSTGVVRPGGGLLAYVSSPAAVTTPVPGFDPGTAYILDLNTGTRLQITQSGKARRVHNWSPDGTWLLLDATVNDICGAVLVSSDGTEVLTIPQACGHYLYSTPLCQDQFSAKLR